jgi:protein involved in polysaccharide export with SLBB domain
VLMRNDKRVPISISKALRGDPLHNVFIHPGDHIYIPPARGGTISVLGMTGSGGTVFPYRNGLRLTEALSLAAGITPGGDRTDIRVIRGPLTEPRIYQTDLKEIVNGDSHDVALHPGDVIYVTDHPLEDFSEVMAAIGPIVSISLAAATLALAIQAQNRD